MYIQKRKIWKNWEKKKKWIKEEKIDRRRRWQFLQKLGERERVQICLTKSPLTQIRFILLLPLLLILFFITPIASSPPPSSTFSHIHIINIFIPPPTQTSLTISYPLSSLFLSILDATKNTTHPMEGGGGAAPPADTVMSDAAPHPEPHQPPPAMGIDNIPATLSHGGRFIQYNIFGNIFEVTAKYKPPIMPIGKGAYGIVWYSLTLFFSLFPLFLCKSNPTPKLVSFWMFFFFSLSLFCGIFLNVRKRWILFYLVGNGRWKFLFGFCFVVCE